MRFRLRHTFQNPVSFPNTFQNAATTEKKNHDETKMNEKQFPNCSFDAINEVKLDNMNLKDSSLERRRIIFRQLPVTVDQSTRTIAVDGAVAVFQPNRTINTTN